MRLCLILDGETFSWPISAVSAAFGANGEDRGGSDSPAAAVVVDAVNARTSYWSYFRLLGGVALLRLASRAGERGDDIACWREPMCKERENKKTKRKTKKKKTKVRFVPKLSFANGGQIRIVNVGRWVAKQVSAHCLRRDTNAHAD